MSSSHQEDDRDHPYLQHEHQTHHIVVSMLLSGVMQPLKYLTSHRNIFSLTHLKIFFQCQCRGQDEIISTRQKDEQIMLLNTPQYV